jgi:hypothetical protein
MMPEGSPKESEERPTLDYATPSQPTTRSPLQVPIGCLFAILIPFAAIMLFFGIWGSYGMIADPGHFDESERIPTIWRLTVGVFAALVCVGIGRKPRKTE